MAGPADETATDRPNLTDDVLVPFRVVRAGMLGRFVRLGSVVDTILTRHAYPEAVSQVLAEAVVLTSLLGAAMKGEGRFTLQTRGDGAVRFLVVNYDTPSKLRAYASFDTARLADNDRSEDDGDPSRSLLGDGHLAFTIDPGAGRERYQGIVPLDGTSLTEAVETYFRQSEQLPTFVKVAVGRERIAGTASAKSGWRWRASGLLVQYVPKLGGAPSQPAADDEDHVYGEDDEDWARVKILAATAEDHELLDPMLTPHRLLYRLFHEDGVRAEPDVAMSATCSCERDRVAAFVETFKATELDDMREADGRVHIRCEFCTTDYVFDV